MGRVGEWGREGEGGRVIYKNHEIPIPNSVTI